MISTPNFYFQRDNETVSRYYDNYDCLIRLLKATKLVVFWYIIQYRQSLISLEGKSAQLENMHLTLNYITSGNGKEGSNKHMWSKTKTVCPHPLPKISKSISMLHINVGRNDGGGCVCVRFLPPSWMSKLWLYFQQQQKRGGVDPLEICQPNVSVLHCQL